MKFAYKFSNLLGTVYREGNLLFTPDGNSVISPVGNRLTIFDLKNNKSTTLPIESRFNYTSLDLSPNGCTLIAINEEGEAHLISLISQTIIHKYRFKSKVNFVRFSPNGKHFAVCKGTNVFVFKAPSQYNSFVMERIFKGTFDDTTCLDWSFDSNILAIGSKDMQTKLFPFNKATNLKAQALGSHTNSIVACFFEKNTYDITTIDKGGVLCIWTCSIEPSDPDAKANIPAPSKKIKNEDDLVEDDFGDSKLETPAEDEMTVNVPEEEMTITEEIDEKKVKKENMYYKRTARHYLADEPRKERRDTTLTAAAYHNINHILVLGFSSGSFFIYELPDVNLIHSLTISEDEITSIALNNTGDWIGIGCKGTSVGRLLVWEWQSETYILKQQGHSTNVTCLTYSPDGNILATGGEDGKVKLWNIDAGYCYVTFSEHTAAVSALSFSFNKKFVVSSSLDGTVRAYDIIRYRNFRTLASPRPVQLSCVDVDSSGEFVAAGGQDCFEIYLWSMKLGRLLEILAGHEGPISSVAFSPIISSTTLASVSWDKTLRIWDAIEKGTTAHETLELTGDGLCVTFRPDGLEVAVATLDGQITFFSVKEGTQTRFIEGRNDLGSGVSDADLITAKKNLQSKAFTCLCYTADGKCLIAGGQSKNICIYNVIERLLMKKFEVTQNRSLDAVDDFINRRKLTEFGNLALVEEREKLEGGNVAIRLPGVRKGDMASRNFKPEVRIFALKFSPTGQQFSAATTEGILIYSLNASHVFDPWDLQFDITPAAIKKAIDEEDHLNALTMALKLNEMDLVRQAVETIPVLDIELIVTNLGVKFMPKLLKYLGSATDDSPHIEFYLIWIQHILTQYGVQIQPQERMPLLLSLQKSLTRKYEQLSKIADFNKYTMQFIMRLGESKSKMKVDNGNEEDSLFMECDNEEE